MTTRFDLPDPVRRRAEREGPAGEQWLADLDGCVDELAERWALDVDRVLTGGTESLVLAVAVDGAPAVLKLGLPGSAHLDVEARILRAADGRGYARCLADDAGYNATLVERLGAPLASLGLAPEAVDEALCEVLGQAWRPAPTDLAVMSGADKARWLADYVERTWRELDAPCPRRVIDRALAQAREREGAHDPATSVLAHGDGHALNALLPLDGGPPEAARFVDPDGLVAEREYDLGILAREWIDDAYLAAPARVGGERAARLARATGTDAAAITAWGDIERVSSGLACLTVGLDEFGERMLAAATSLVD